MDLFIKNAPEGFVSCSFYDCDTLMSSFVLYSETKKTLQKMLKFWEINNWRRFHSGQTWLFLDMERNFLSQAR